MLKKILTNNIIFYLLIIATICFSVLYFQLSHLKYAVILNGLSVISFLSILFLFQYKYKEYELKQFIKQITVHLNSINIFAESYKKENELYSDVVIFLPNKILLFYPLQYKGTVVVNENILNENKQPIKNMTKIKQEIEKDMIILQNHFVKYCNDKAYIYEQLSVIPVIYLPYADIKNYNSYNQFIITNQTRLNELISYNILNENHNVYDYEGFIYYLKNNHIIQ